MAVAQATSPALLPDEITTLGPGMTFWHNPKNGFAVLKLHYSADPAKRTPEWKQAASKAMPLRGWKQEYEIAFDAPAGRPVFEEFSAAEMVRPFPVLPGARLLRGWDFGWIAPAAVFCQLDVWGRLLVHDCLLGDRTLLDQFAPMVKARSLELLGSTVGKPFDCGDTQADFHTDLGTIRKVLTNHGIQLYTVPKTDESYEALRTRMVKGDVFIPGEGKSPGILVHPRAAILIEALQGAFHLSDRPPYKIVETHPYKDVVDALRYLHDNLSFASHSHMDAMKTAASADIVY